MNDDQRKKLQKYGFLTKSQKNCENQDMPFTINAVNIIVSSFFNENLDCYLQNCNLKKDENFEIHHIYEDKIFITVKKAKVIEEYEFNIEDLCENLRNMLENKLNILIVLIDNTNVAKEGFAKYHFFTMAKCKDSYYILDSEGKVGEVLERIRNSLQNSKIFAMRGKIQRDKFNCGSFSCCIAEELIKKFTSFGYDLERFNNYMQTFFYSKGEGEIFYELVKKDENGNEISFLPIELCKYNQSFNCIQGMLILQEQYLELKFNEINNKISIVVEAIQELNQQIVIGEDAKKIQTNY